MNLLTTPVRDPAPADLLQQSADRRRRAEEDTRHARNAVIEREINRGKFLYSGPDYYLAIADTLISVNWLGNRALYWLNVAFNIVTAENPTRLLHTRQEMAVCAIVAKALRVDVNVTYQEAGVQAPFDGYLDTPNGRRFVEVKMLTQGRQYMLPSNEAYMWMRQPVSFYGIVMRGGEIVACCTGYTKEPFIYGDDGAIPRMTADWLDLASRRNW